MLSSLWHRNSAFRIFSFSGFITAAVLVAVFILAGPAAFLIAVALIIIEVTFSFDNAVINARVLRELSPFWQKIFLTVGIAIAVFGMRIIFPIAIVAITTTLNWREVLNLSLNDPNKYAIALKEAEPAIAAFGSAFLLMLVLHFFTSREKKVHWFKLLEKGLIAIPGKWSYAAMVAFIVVVVAAMPSNQHPEQTLKAGFAGIVIYAVIHWLSTHFMPRLHHRRIARTGVAGFVGFLYLEILDASFSLDSVIGAFALTNKVLLIAAGLGVGAIWVRSMTVYITRRETLNVYRYLEHGAHYAVGILALSLLISLFLDIPEVVTGIFGVSVIVLAVLESRKANKEKVSELAEEVQL
ncbi:DUF475 domain-containing protein [Candidatus Saccharibacteria bacterium]|nr:DUF475 domain-containing protein [Candidatus Saccharibacteria bacterium]